MVYIIVGSFIALDFLTGMLKALKNKNFDSTKMREGLFHKMGSIGSVAFGVLVDYAQGYVDLGVEVPISTSVCVYIILMECGSIIENLAEINPQIMPNKIKTYFAKINS